MSEEAAPGRATMAEKQVEGAVTTRLMELVTALVIVALGLLVVYDSHRVGASWGGSTGFEGGIVPPGEPARDVHAVTTSPAQTTVRKKIFIPGIIVPGRVPGAKCVISRRRPANRELRPEMSHPGPARRVFRSVS